MSNNSNNGNNNSIWKIPLIIFSIVAAIIILDIYGIRTELFEAFGVKIKTQAPPQPANDGKTVNPAEDERYQDLQNKVDDLTEQERKQRENEL